jgi:hypothetical protein
LRKVATPVVGVLVIVAGVLAYTNIDIIEQLSIGRDPIQGVPESSASAVTQPPPNMDGINTHTDVYGTGADSDIITLGPETGGQPG